MTEKGTSYTDEQQITAALAEELGQVVPRRDLWPSIQTEVLRQQGKHRKWWQVPPFGPLVMLRGHTPALRLTGISLGSVAVVLMLAWLILLPPGQNLSQDLLARNVRGYWYDHASGRFVGMVVLFFKWAEEHQEHRPAHVQCAQHGGKQGQYDERDVAVVAHRHQNLVLAPEAGEYRDAAKG